LLRAAEQSWQCCNEPTAVGFSHFDHVTINTGTILPIALWLQHLLGFEKYWETEFTRRIYSQ